MTGPTLLTQRRAGVLLHISSLPSSKGKCGDFGQEAFNFVDFLHHIGASVWQTLPLNMPHADDSPYQCLSAHAGNPEFISLEKLEEKNWLSADDLISNSTNKETLFVKAYNNFILTGAADEKIAFTVFCKIQANWLNKFALFYVLRHKFSQVGWFDWPVAYKEAHPDTMADVEQQYANEILVVKFTQFIFFNQWHDLKSYALNHGVYLFGDIPIFVSYNSADVWAQPELFKLDEDNRMSVVAGVPPDYFSTTGQRWGNPHYNWKAMKADGFKWWLNRMATQNVLFDMVRIDHFRGLESAWEIPVSEETAINGQWIIAPGDALLATIKKQFSHITLVAEDLGIITEAVEALREKHKLPGMKILQFAFGDNDNNPYLPHNIEQNSVIYTGTHDNDTSLGWYQSANEHERNHLAEYIGVSNAEVQTTMPFALIKMALNSKAQLAIVPMQDILELDSHHRMNTPGTITGNWHWQFNWEQLSYKQVVKIKKAIYQSNRSA